MAPRTAASLLLLSFTFALSTSSSGLALTKGQNSSSGLSSKPKGSVRTSRQTAANADSGCTPCDAASLNGASLQPVSLSTRPPARRTRGRASRKTVTVPCHPKGYVDPKIARNYQTAMREMKHAGLTPHVTSTWRSSAAQAEMRRCSLNRRCRARRGIYSANPSGQSLHEAGLAVDIAGVAGGRRGSKRLTARGRRIVRIMEKNGFDWRYGMADPAHFETDPRKVGYRNLSQAIRRSQTTCQVKLATAQKVRKRSRSNSTRAAA